MAATFLKQKKSASFGLNYISKIRPSKPPYRETLPGGFPWQDKSAQTDLSLILDSDKTVAILSSLKEEMMSVREEVRLTKKYLQSEYENLLQKKSIDLTRRVTESMFFMENTYQDRVENLKHAFRQQVSDFLARENSIRVKENPPIPSLPALSAGQEQNHDRLIYEIDILRKKETSLSDEVKKRDDAMSVMKAKLNQYTQQQQHLQNIQQQQQQHLVSIQARKTRLKPPSLTALDEPEDYEEDAEGEYRMAKLGEMHQLKLKHQSEMKLMLNEMEKLRNTNTNIQEVLSRRDTQLNTLTFEIDRLNKKLAENEISINDLKGRLRDTTQTLHNERTEATRMVNEIKNKMAQEAERQERRRKMQQFMQDPSKMMSKDLSVDGGQATSKDEVLKLLFERDLSTDLWDELKSIIGKVLGAGDEYSSDLGRSDVTSLKSTTTAKSKP